MSVVSDEGATHTLSLAMERSGSNGNGNGIGTAVDVREKVRLLATLNLKGLQSGLDEAEHLEQEQLRGELGTAGEAPSTTTTP